MSQRRVALYLRCNSNEFDSQLLKLRHFAERQGWQVVFEYVDEPIKDLKEFKLPQLDKLLADSRLNVFDMVLFFKFSNFAHPSLKYTIKSSLQVLQNNKVGWCSFKEPFFSTNSLNSDLMYSFLDLFSSVISSNVSIGTRTGQQKAVRRGIKIGRKGLSEEVKQEVRKHREMGISYSQISKLVTYMDCQGKLKHISKTSISKILSETKTSSQNGGQ